MIIVVEQARIVGRAVGLSGCYSNLFELLRGT
jgi:hypothetical protein